VLTVLRPSPPAPALGEREVHVWRFRDAGREPVLDLLERYAGTRLVERGKHGKPFVPGHEVRFNLSHSGALTVCAFARGREVGIDVERENRKVEPLKLAQRFFAPDEAEAVRNGGREVFFRLWTRKEAYLKALGLGIGGIGLTTFSALPAERWVEGGRMGECLLWDLEVDEGYMAALAVRGV